MCNFYKIRKIRSARKEHTCYLCGEKIKKGAQYTHYVGYGPDGFFSMDLHEDCYDVVEEYWAELYDQDDGWDDEMVMDFVRESINDAGLEVPETRKEQISMFLGLEEK